MKHGQKTKGKTAKARVSGKKGSPKAAAKGKASQSKKSSAKASAAAAKASSKPKAAPSNGKGRSTLDSVTFNNPIVANAFKRAVKKYPTAFRRLTD